MAAVLSMVVALGVFWQLMQPAVTMTPDPICGQAAHRHDSACYERLLVCALAEDENHTHGEGCYQSILTCGLAEHEHTAACYPAEIAEPTQAPTEAPPTDAPAVQAEEPTAAPVIEPGEDSAPDAAEEDAEPTQTPAAEPADEPTQAPEEAVSPEPSAMPDEEAATPTACPTEAAAEESTEEPSEESTEEPTEEPVEEPTEEPDAESVSLALTSLQASAAQVTAGQTVTWTFAAEGTDRITYAVTDENGVILAQGEAAGDCRQISWLACQAGRVYATVTAHGAGEALSLTSGVEVLPTEQLAAFVSASERFCFAGDSLVFSVGASGGAAPVTLHATAAQDGVVIAEGDVTGGSWTIATQEAAKAGSVTVTLYATDALGAVAEAGCTVPVAVNKTESREQWTASAAISRSGQWPQDVAAVARTQLGYKESEDNFIINDKGERCGWTRYGAWYGASYGEWCAMYASFCLHYAGVPESDFPREASCSRWISALRGQSLYAAAGEAEPDVGDMIFLDWEKDGAVDHVGIVTRVSGGTVTTIEGNVEHMVAERSYALTDGRIVGYGLLNKAWDVHQASQEQESADEPDGADVQADAEADSLIATATTLVDEPEADLLGADDASAGEQTVTVTFTIDNEAYTNDPGSGNTHLTAKEDLSSLPGSAGLTYTKWGTGRYKITGTGTIASYTIPANTSLADNGLAAPGISVENIGTTNAVTYVSPYSWLNGTQLCSVNAAFGEDTVLTLCLYEAEKTYSLDFVCDETERHSVTYVLGGYPNATFTLGQRVSEAYIPAKEAVNEGYYYEKCTHGHAHGERFVGWYVKDCQTGKAVPFGPDVTLTADYEAEDADRTIRVYAQWEAEPAQCTVTYYVDGAQQGDAITLTVGDALGTLPEAPSKDGYVFLGWRAEGETTYATKETVINADTAFTAVYGHTVLFRYENRDVAYLVEHGMALSTVMGALPEAPEGKYWQEDQTDLPAALELVVERNLTFTLAEMAMVQVRFVYQDYETEATIQLGETLTMPAGGRLGDSLTELPVPPVFSGYTFKGWFSRVGETETAAEATLETEVFADTTFTAVYDEVQGYIVTLHDMGPDGQEILSEGVAALDVLVPSGSTLADYLADVVLTDGTPASACRWYTLDANGGKVAYSLNTPVISKLEVYTYTYQLVLRLNEAGQNAGGLRWLMASAQAEAVSLDGDTLTLTLREGHVFKASDFVINGVDYSLYTWRKADGSAFSLIELVGQTLDESIEVTGTQPEDMGSFTINFYLSVNGEWKKLTTQTLDVYYSSTPTYPTYALSAAQLEAVYGAYGFDADSFTTSSNRFPHATEGAETIWADRGIFEENGIVFSPILRTTGSNCDVYYLPVTNLTGGKDKNELAGTNTFYTVTVKDGTNQVYGPEELPPVQYVLTGTNATIEVSNVCKDGTACEWKCTGDAGTAVNGTASGGTTTFRISGIDQAYTIKPTVVAGEGQVVVTYNLSAPTTQYPPDNSDDQPQIGGSTDEYTLVLEATGSHEILAPNPTVYFTNKGNYKDRVVFTGWTLNGKVVQPGETLNLEDYARQTVVLTGNWEYVQTGTDGKNSANVNFFVALNAVPEGTISWVGSTETSNFTKSVYSADCGVTVTDAVTYGLYNKNESGVYFVLGGTSGADLNATHNEVTQLKNGYTVPGKDYAHEYLCTFPTDEQVLKVIRGMELGEGKEITINGNEIPKDKLTTENFTIRWYVFKEDGSDGWHIDGILVAKKSEMIVRKTFAGDTSVLKELESYQISVSPTDNTATPVHTGGVLTLGNADAHDAATNTYTWRVPVDQYFQYTVEERNYEPDDAALYTTDAEVRVEHSNVAAENTAGWVSGTSRVVTGRGNYEDDTDQLQVAFLNTYTAPGTLILRKVDAATGNGMEGVSFAVSKSDGGDFQLYRLDGSRYTANPSGGGTPVADNVITTDYSGQAYLFIGGGTYVFDELIPTGYDDPGNITVVLDGDADNYYKVVAIQSAEAEKDGKFVEISASQNKLELIVKNYARTVDLQVQKEWVDGENKQVKLQLYRNGISLGSAYSVTLDGSKNWVHTWENVPLYTDGGLASYTVREEAIGEYAYSQDYPDDGYRYYTVKYDAAQYLDEAGNATELSQARTICLKVHNMRSKGDILVNKVDGHGAPLAGATFNLYPATEEEVEIGTEGGVRVLKKDGAVLTPSKTAVSDGKGVVNFGVQNAGEYYMIEASAPAQYAGDNALFKLTFDGSSVVMQRRGEDGNWTPVTEVVNVKSTADVTITKVDANGQALTGATFQLRRLVDNNYENQKIVSDIGSYIFSELEAGEYQLVETEAPAGYYKLTQPIPFTIAVDGTVTCDAKDGMWRFDGENNVITVINNTGSQLPATGGSGTFPYIFGGLLLIAISLMCGFGWRRKGERGDEA